MTAGLSSLQDGGNMAAQLMYATREHVRRFKQGDPAPSTAPVAPAASATAPAPAPANTGHARAAREERSEGTYRRWNWRTRARMGARHYAMSGALLRRELRMMSWRRP